MVWYSQLFKNFPVCCDPHKGFSVVNEAEVNIFLESPCFFYDPTDVGNLISGSSTFSKSTFSRSRTSEVLSSRTIEAYLEGF